jgi:hypothetical protein
MLKTGERFYGFVSRRIDEVDGKPQRREQPDLEKFSFKREPLRQNGLSAANRSLFGVGAEVPEMMN